MRNIQNLALALTTTLLTSTVALAASDSASVSSTSVQNQSTSGQSIVRSIAPQISYIYSNVEGSGFGKGAYSDVKAKSGTGIGLVTEIGRGDVLFETGALYREMGVITTPNFANVSGSAGLQGTQSTINLKYVTLPLMAKAYTDRAAPSSLYLKAGLLASILADKSESTDWSRFGLNHSNISNGQAFAAGSPAFLDSLESYELAGQTAIGARFKLGGNTSLNAEINYTRGLTSMMKTAPTYNTALGATAGVALDL